MRGALVSCLDHAVKNRIIPADAGSTLLTTDMTSKVEDHPRGCGEHILENIIIIFPEGSSPRMRGAHLRYHH